MYFAVEVEARASLVHPPTFLVVFFSVEEEELCVVCEGVCEGVSGDVVGSEVGVVVTVGGVSETGSVASVATPLTPLE
jgi:hypothetical protein